jgi:hypothetical protein
VLFQNRSGIGHEGACWILIQVTSYAK